jgi:hypothetical protein
MLQYPHRHSPGEIQALDSMSACGSTVTML